MLIFTRGSVQKRSLMQSREATLKELDMKKETFILVVVIVLENFQNPCRIKEKYIASANFLNQKHWTTIFTRYLFS